MLSDSDLNAPAHLLYEPTAAGRDEAQLDWGGAKSFSSLREALHWAMGEEAPAGQGAFIRTASGRVLRPDMLEQLWTSVQGP